MNEKKRRRNDRVRLPAILKFAGYEKKVFLNQHGEPSDVIVKVESGGHSQRTYKILGPGQRVEAKRQEISKKRPEIKWTEIDLKEYEPPESRIEFQMDISGPIFRRLAAKVAFERFAQLRPTTILVGNEFDPIREFVRLGEEPQICCGLLSDIRLLRGPLNFPVPNNAIVTIGHPRDRVLGGFVSFYGLFYYWVVLSRKFEALAPIDDLYLEHPQSREARNPQLRGGVGSIRIQWVDLFDSARRDPRGGVRQACLYAKEKFQQATDTFYGSSETN